MKRIPPTRRLIRGVSGAGALCALLLLGAIGGCAGGGSSQLKQPADAGLATLLAGQDKPLIVPPDGDVDSKDVGPLAAQAAMDLEAVLKQQSVPTKPGGDGAGREKPQATGGGPGFSLADAVSDRAKPAPAPDPAPPAVEAPPPPVLDADALAKAADEWSEVVAKQREAAAKAAAPAATGDPVVDLASRIARLIREPREGEQVGSPAIVLASLEALRPGSLDQLADPASELSRRLPPDDRKTLLDAREKAIRDPGVASEAVREAISKLQGPVKQVRVAKAELCTRVEGFGRYTAFSSRAFVAGQPIRAIVYSELEQFSYRPAREGDPAQRGVPLAEQESVDLSQSLSLYHDRSGLLVWHRPAQAVIETTRARRHDFYLIQQVELPRTLGVGRYNLKVTVKDRTTGAESEAIIPFDVVADAALARGE